ncbi:S-formylglutathione hydrolase [Simiduia curdlanivorans]|uniref:S-formylglutathione hydrolase n=1 Tax=Simiduia curdlanivorans TaxID=1492769 RepID=A0ABV8V3B6_9GAMM|nr:S-formylglutathione hydrolase [Simiduia curdlanivorans]MDN3640123.1 S-formylglutathione hydrolase [Simiduia curdlanivorans]
MEKVADVQCFGGQQQRFKHVSLVLNCDMHFSLFLPPQAKNAKVPVLVWLSGLTCTDENFVTKAGAQRVAAELGIALLAPDTSPRGEGVADDEAYDAGMGAGFYVNATQAPWAEHYQMYDYIVQELPALLAREVQALDLKRMSIMGHSMGGHGALVIGLRNVDTYQSISAFAPICAPSQCPWGEKTLGYYLGQDRSTWQDYDASVLLASAKKSIPIRVDQGLADNFLTTQLMPEKLIAAAPQNYPLQVLQHKGYDHSYFFIASFIEAHIRFHAEFLNQ